MGGCNNVQVWDLSNDKVIATLQIANCDAFELFVKDGVQMLASHDPEKIEIWKISTQSKVKTIYGPDCGCEEINQVGTYKEGKNCILLVCDRASGTFFMWDLDGYEFIARQDTNQRNITSLQV